MFINYDYSICYEDYKVYHIATALRMCTNKQWYFTLKLKFQFQQAYFESALTITSFVYY